DEAKAYQDELEDEINRQRIEAGKRPFTLDLEKEVKLKERKISGSIIFCVGGKSKAIFY
ncbi:IS5/IS1182 family transposase, partial [Enterococcus faecium]|nr:IS5/IS1182 family transposase [Enterococcus faecium]NTM86167.1 IS5/IS1182 family transposase [Enterococcus faecium]NTN40426.1 IS5/IS1182 family transposase [Enterococcus faecium]